MSIAKTQRINLHHILSIVAVGLILTIPMLVTGVTEAHDLLGFHLKWSKHFAEQFWSGDLYPRWLLDMNAGLGSPTFFFYAPVPYYITSLFHPLFANDTQGWYQLWLTASLALVASGMTSYLWFENITNQNVAFISSIIYMALPYHLAVDLYWRFAFAEYWTFVWIPLILYFSKKLIDGHRLSIIGLAISFALLIMTHLPTFIIFFPVPVCYLLFTVGKRQRRKVLISTIAGLMIAFGLSAVYWLPAITTQQYISMNAIREGRYYYGSLFLFSNPPHPYEKFFWRYLEVLTLLMGGLACSAFIMTRNHSAKTLRREGVFWLAIATIALFMTLPISKPVWDVLTVVQRIQFSWRFNSVLAFAVATLVALGLSSIEAPFMVWLKPKLSVGLLSSASLLLSVLGTLPILLRHHHLPGSDNSVLLIAIAAFIIWRISSLKRPVNFSAQKPLFISILLIASLVLTNGIVIKKRAYSLPSNTVKTELQISMDADEYRPKWVSKDIFQPRVVSQLSKTKAEVTEGQGNLSIQRWQPRNIVLQTNATTNIELTINQFYYPGWTARLNGQSRPLPIQPSAREGLLHVKVPSGKQEVKVTLNAGVQERLGQISSAVSALVTLLLGFWFYKVGQRSVSYRLEQLTE